MVSATIFGEVVLHVRMHTRVEVDRVGKQARMRARMPA